MKDAITEALGLPDLPDYVFGRVRENILTDNRVYNLIIRHVLELHAPSVLKNMHQLERDRLRKTLGYGPQPKGTSWGVVEEFSSGKKHLRAVCAACNQDMNFFAPEPWREDFKPVPGQRPRVPIDHPVTGSDIRKHLENVRWQHCGRADRPPLDTLLAWENYLHGLVQS